MIINLIKTKQMFSLTLPHKVKGQYWVTDIDDNGKPRDLISVEAVDGSWVVKSNKSVSILNSENKPVARCLLTYYHNDDNAYLGFFEAENNITAMRELILKVKAKAKHRQPFKV